MLNQFNLICEFALFLYHAGIVRVLNALQKQEQVLLTTLITNRFGETGAVSVHIHTGISGVSPLPRKRKQSGEILLSL